MLSNESDSSLVLSAQNGDWSAFSILFQRHQAILRALCRRTLADGTQADDIVQEAALQAMLNIDHLQNNNRFGPWLCGIGLNLCRRWLRAGLTYAETAAHLGIEISAVRTRLHKARRALRRQLGEYWKETTMEKRTANSKAVPVRVADVRRTPTDGDKPGQFIVILEEIDGERRLPIWIGQSEAIAIVLQLEKLQWPRPSTYSFTAGLLRAIGGRLREIIITKLDDAEVFYAVAIVEGARKKGTVDARPSDAINLALMTGAPIRVEPVVFETALAKPEPGADPFGEGAQGLKDIVAEVEATWKASFAVARQP